MYTVTKKMTFEASHKLILPYESACKNLHGHSYKVEVTVYADKLDDNGFVMDFTHLKPIQKWLDDNWDHATIVSETDPDLVQVELLSCKCFKFPGGNVSAEHMCKHIHGITLELLKESPNYANFRNIKVRIFETANNFAEYKEAI